MQQLVDTRAVLRTQAGAVKAALTLFGDGATVPFVARYRKEATVGSMKCNCGLFRAP